ncbi:MAG: putative transport system permease protein, partial [Pseudonocardiales bacterium]|nr:putative transport system permease protein [Pseudonocardiales bacterium]
MTRTWLAGLLTRQPVRLLSSAVGIAVAVALLASLGSFLAQSKASMTDRAVRSVAVDWQVQVHSGADPATVLTALRAVNSVRATAVVDFAATTGMTATTGGSRQSTGAGVVLGLPDSYRSQFPGELRTLAGADAGVLLAQQTASNLHAAPGDKIVLGRAGLAPVTLTVTGVIDLPQADSLFQTVGAPVGSQPTAPPDNVLVLPQNSWHRYFDPLAGTRPDLIKTQIHVAREHHLPADPAAAYTSVTAAAHNLEAATAGAAVVGNNLGAALGAARQDAAYAQVLFLFLGVPGAVLAALLTATIATAGSVRRRNEQALLRVRGASERQLARLVAVEAAVIAVIGCVLGLAGAAVVGYVVFASAGFGTSAGTAALWAGLAAGAGILIAGGAILLPARRDLHQSTVNSARAVVGAHHYPWWARYGIDIAVLIGSGLIFTATSRNGYQLVLAPEGVPTISVSYWAFAGPALLWLGAGLLIWRLTDLSLGRGRPLTSRLLRPLAGRLAGTVAAGMSRQRRPLVKAVVVLALALAFAVSTATFNATYRQQAEADAQLTNGADVTVTESPGRTVGPAAAAQLASVSGVRAVEPVQHRFAYIGTDLQDLYGVRPDTIRHATALQDGYFSGGTAAGLMSILAHQPDSILVSAETVKDYQLHTGDTLTLRLVDARTQRRIAVPFHYVGVVSEFPTAPKDSFFVTNANYVAQRTGSDAVGSFLVDTGGKQIGSIARDLQRVVGTSASVTDIATVRKTVGSSLTAVDLVGLTRVELTFALLIAVSAAGLVLALGLAERRRSLAIITALGARPKQLRAFIASETLVLGVGGLIFGAMTGWLLARMLVKVLTGVFDPPPTVL